jgi:hypothetical protein
VVLSFQAVTLDSSSPDQEGTLVFRNGRLLAVVTCLSDIHPELAGRWFVEATFGSVPIVHPPAFETLDQFEDWIMNAE